MNGNEAAAAMAMAVPCVAPNRCSSAPEASFKPPETMPPLRELAPQPMRSASSTTASRPSRCTLSAAESPA